MESSLIRIQSFFHKLNSHPWIAEGIALVAGIAYVLQLWMYAHTRESILDEGAYLYKGYLFVTGQYSIYQDYGPWSNHMPLSFLIPGYIQALFGPGLGVGRYFAIFLAVLILLGLWILAKRLGNRWWAAAIVLVFAWNPVIPRFYSVAVSQGLIACMLVWTLVLVLGEDRPLWQILLGVVLSGLMIMTRINMLPVLPLLVLYLFWEHGIKTGALASVAGALTVIIGHAFFWPEILQMWAYWLPPQVSPFMDSWRLPESYVRYWDPEVTLWKQLLSVFQSYRYHFTAVTGAIATWLLFAPKSKWKSQSNFRIAVFLSALFVILLLMHIWATLGNNYCVFCLSGYLAFFSMVGLLIVIVSFSEWRRQLPLWQQLFIALIILVLFAGIGYGAFETIGKGLSELPIPDILLQVTGVSLKQNNIGEVLALKYDLEKQDLRRIIPSAVGLLAGILVLVFAAGVAIISSVYQSKASKPKVGVLTSFGYWALFIFLFTGTLLAPTVLFGGGQGTYDCSGNVIDSYSAAGEHLALRIPPGSKVYWQGGLSVVPLLYVPGITIYPPQINGDYSYYIGGVSDTLLKYGFWNEVLAQQWIEDADFILIEERSYKRWLIETLDPNFFDELTPSPPTVPCRGNAQIGIFKRLR
jgi:hypothetical protein